MSPALLGGSSFLLGILNVRQQDAQPRQAELYAGIVLSDRAALSDDKVAGSICEPSRSICAPPALQHFSKVT
jgi:hypothetical protein